MTRCGLTDKLAFFKSQDVDNLDALRGLDAQDMREDLKMSAGQRAKLRTALNELQDKKQHTPATVQRQQGGPTKPMKSLTVGEALSIIKKMPVWKPNSRQVISKNVHYQKVRLLKVIESDARFHPFVTDGVMDPALSAARCTPNGLKYFLNSQALSSSLSYALAGPEEE